MNIGNVTGVNAYRRSAAAKPPKSVEQRNASDERSRDRLELQFTDVLTAEKEGWIEIGGRRFTVSEEMAAELRRSYDLMQARNEARAARQAAEQNAKAAEQQAKAISEQGDAMAKALEIARRIAKGGRVPPEDEQFLMEFSQEIYMAAKMQAVMAKEHEDYDSVLEDEEDGESAESAPREPAGAAAEHLEASVCDGAVDGCAAVSAESGE